MAFNFLKNKNANIPPDVGRENELEKEKNEINKKLSQLQGNSDFGPQQNVEEEQQTESYMPHFNHNQGYPNPPSVSNDSMRYEFEKINAKMESFESILKGYGERYSLISQQIGELRAMNLSSEKDIAKISAESSRAIDIVKEVKPEKLSLDYQKLDAKIQENKENLASLKEYMEEIMKEVKEVRRKAEGFAGTESLLKLSQDVKKDLSTIEKMNEEAKIHANKSEQLFIEFNRSFSKNQKINSEVSGISEEISDFRKEIEGIKIKMGKIASNDDVSDIRNEVGKKLALMEKVISSLESGKMEDERLAHLVDNALSISKQNKEDISDIALIIGNDKIRKVADYESKLNSILGVLDNLAEQIVDIKKRVGMSARTNMIEKIEMIANDKINEEGIPELKETLKRKENKVIGHKKKILRKSK